MDEGIVDLLSSGFAKFLPLLLVVYSSEQEIVLFFLFCIYEFSCSNNAIGVNDVTRVLERMPAAAAATHSTDSSSEAQTVPGRRRAPLVPLQVTFLSLFATGMPL
jgi:hypothetical protein